MYKAFRDIIEKTDDDDNAWSSIVVMLLQIVKAAYWNTPLEFTFWNAWIPVCIQLDCFLIMFKKHANQEVY